MYLLAHLRGRNRDNGNRDGGHGFVGNAVQRNGNNSQIVDHINGLSLLLQYIVVNKTCGEGVCIFHNVIVGYNQKFRSSFFPMMIPGTQAPVSVSGDNRRIELAEIILHLLYGFIGYRYNGGMAAAAISETSGFPYCCRNSQETAVRSSEDRPLYHLCCQQMYLRAASQISGNKYD